MKGPYCLWFYLTFATASGESLNSAREEAQYAPHTSCASLAVLGPRSACFCFCSPVSLAQHWQDYCEEGWADPAICAGCTCCCQWPETSSPSQISRLWLKEMERWSTEATKWRSSVGTLEKWTKIYVKAVRHSHPVGQSRLSQISSQIHCTSEPFRITSVPYIWESNKLGIECLWWMLSCQFLTFPAACSHPAFTFTDCPVCKAPQLCQLCVSLDKDLSWAVSYSAGQSTLFLAPSHRAVRNPAFKRTLCATVWSLQSSERS